MDEATQRAFDAEIRLRGLATDILEHEGCEGCRINAAQALEFLGAFEDTLARLGVEDPREVQRRRWEEHRARAVAGRPPRLRLNLDAEIVLNEPSPEMEERVWAAVQEAVGNALAGIPGASMHGSSAVVVIDPE
jgi:hypothetical protein